MPLVVVLLGTRRIHFIGGRRANLDEELYRRTDGIERLYKSTRGHFRHFGGNLGTTGRVDRHYRRSLIILVDWYGDIGRRPGRTHLARRFVAYRPGWTQFHSDPYLDRCVELHAAAQLRDHSRGPGSRAGFR